MSWKKARALARLEVLEAIARDRGEQETAIILRGILTDITEINEVSEVVSRARAGKGLLGQMEFDRKVDEMAECLYENLAPGNDYTELNEESREPFQTIVRKMLLLLE